MGCNCALREKAWASAQSLLSELMLRCFFDSFELFASDPADFLWRLCSWPEQLLRPRLALACSSSEPLVVGDRVRTRSLITN